MPPRQFRPFARTQKRFDDLREEAKLDIIADEVKLIVAQVTQHNITIVEITAILTRILRPSHLLPDPAYILHSGGGMV